MRAPDVLVELQRCVEELHGTEGAPDVRAFVVDDTMRRTLPGARADVPEQLFVREDPTDPDALELALYIAPRIVAALAHDDPHRRLHAGNLEDYWIALEGVSHFVLVSSRAESQRKITALELEIQAEVDKFVAAWRLLREQGMSADPAARQLMRKLFGPYALHEPMPRDEADRYHVATRVARRFCVELSASFGQDAEPTRAEHAVRRFVRLELAEKLRAA
jgi:hypothetical protein